MERFNHPTITILCSLVIPTVWFCLPAEGQAFEWTPSDEALQKYRRSWNPMSNGPILLTAVDLNPKGQFHTQYFVFSELAHAQFNNALTTHRSDAPFRLGAVAPLVVLGYGLTDHLELNAAFSAIYWDATRMTGSGGRSSTADTGIGDTALYLKYRPIIQDPDSWRPSITLYNQLSLPTSTYFGTSPIPGNFSPLGKLPASPFGGLEWTEGVLFRKNVKPFRLSGGVFYTYTAPGSTGGMNTYMGDIVNTRLILEHILDDDRGFGYNIELVSIHGLPFRADGHTLNVTPASFQLFGIEPAIQYKFSSEALGGQLVGAVGILFTIGGQNDLSAIYPNLSLYWYFGRNGKAVMR